MSEEVINVTKTFLPPINEYEEYLKKIWSSDWLTNQGPLLQEFELGIKSKLNVNNFQLVGNGTLALQLALQALGVTEGEVITTPFSYVATTSAILWERCTPIFVDIDPESFCIDPNKIEEAITEKTKAILPVHVFGNPCDVEKIEEIAKRHNLKVIYDGAHAFGAEYLGQSLLNFGDISITSFHATKLFHTIEGGGLITNDTGVSQRIELLKRFGHHGDNYQILGINAKATEFQAAMGLCNLKYIDEIIAKRKQLVELYDQLLGSRFFSPPLKPAQKPNYGYYPVLFDSEAQLLKVMAALNEKNIFPRRYFYPSLNKLPYIDSEQSCPVSEKIASSIACLPLYTDLEEGKVKEICEIINGVTS